MWPSLLSISNDKEITVNESMVTNPTELADGEKDIIRLKYGEVDRVGKESMASKAIFNAAAVVIETDEVELKDKIFCWRGRGVTPRFFNRVTNKEEPCDSTREVEHGRIFAKTKPYGFFVTVTADEIKKKGKRCDLVGLGSGIRWDFPIKIGHHWNVYLRVETTASAQRSKGKSYPWADGGTLPRETVQVVIDPDKPKCEQPEWCS